MRSVKRFLCALGLACGLLIVSGCAPAASAPGGERGGDTSPTSPPMPTAVPEPPAATITAVIDDRPISMSAEFAAMSCSPHAFASLAADGRSGSATLPPTDAVSPGRVSVAIIDSHLLVVFSAQELPTFTDLGQDVVASLTNVHGSAIVVELPPGEIPAIGEVDLSQGDEMSATLQAELVCRK